MPIRLVMMLSRFMAPTPDGVIRRCWSGLRSGSVAHELYFDLVRRGRSHEEASRVGADAFHDDPLASGSTRLRNRQHTGASQDDPQRPAEHAS